MIMNYIRGTAEHPIWIGDYRKDDKSLQTCYKQVGGVTSSNAQESYVMVDGVPTHPYSTIICSTRELFIETMERPDFLITNPDNLEIPL
jgi:hypothetical protein